MKRLLPTLLLCVASAAATPTVAPAGAQAAQRYDVDHADTVHHVFAVALRVPPLTVANDIFEFAATAPGTYQTMNIGRFVHDFTALDAAGASVPTEHISINEWRLASPERVRRITYRVTATRDTTVTADPIYPMCGTSLDADYALINGQGVFGFPRGMQAVPLTIHLSYPNGWTAGTPLAEQNGVYLASSYDRLVDSPILLGAHLSRATLDVTGVPVTIVVRAARNDIQATQLRDAMQSMLTSAGAFLGRLPVDHYTFLYDFAPTLPLSGAWEHSYGSEYTLPDIPYTAKYGAQVRSIAAHEFFHVMTPLNIHSEIIEHFNFATPVASQHLWLYEGTTEWAAQKMQLVSGLITVPAYLDIIAGKARADRTQFDTTWSLQKMSLASYSDSGQRQYSNIYARGAVVAGLLDIKLLQLSDGKRGLRELILDLAQEYGKRRPFPEATFIDSLVARTSPTVRDFFDRYILGTEAPPLKDYYGKLGITLINDDKGVPLRFELDTAATPTQLALRSAWMGPRARMR
jgi:predicted metalloprotease with PDZ domain